LDGLLRVQENLQYLPCCCPICRKYSVQDIKELPRGVRENILAEHNLHVTMSEIETVKQAIVEGRLWDLVETRAKAHPQMTAALYRLSKYSKYFEKGSSVIYSYFYNTCYNFTRVSRNNTFIFT